MFVVSSLTKLQASLLKARIEGKTIGLVPTMGALHQGHCSLIERAVSQCDYVVVSIFVNPLQFAPQEDLAEYPRTLDTDAQLCQELGANLVFAPTMQDLGITGNTASQKETTTIIPPQSMTSVMCGQYRPDHFTGVATIVTKLLNLICPAKAYFGQKDAQQLAIIHRLVKDLNMAVEIVPCPIVRETSGLALSSRNQYLSESEKSAAAILNQGLKAAANLFRQGITDSATLIEKVKTTIATVPEVKLQYVELVEPSTLQPLTTVATRGLLAIAAYLGETRLIDNTIVRQPIIAIDGPAGAGKSSVTRRLAKELGLLYLDTGAMYRSVTWLAMDREVAVTDEAAIAELVKGVKIDLIPRQTPHLPVEVMVNGTEVTQAIRTPEVTANVSTVAAQAAVRAELVTIQKSYGQTGGIVAEGRDIGTNVFPDAELKIFLTATPGERARRRMLDLENQGYKDIDVAKLEEEIKQRDLQDSTRAIAPLKKAADAIEIVTDNMTIEEVIAEITKLYGEIGN